MSSVLHPALMRLLAQHGADVTASTSNGRNMLIAAAQSGCLQIAQYAEKKGLPIDSKDVDGRTALSWAAGKGFRRIITWLAARQANIETSDNMGRTPLIHAATQGNLIRRAGSADEVAEAILFLLTNDFVTGTVVDVDGGALLP